MRDIDDLFQALAFSSFRQRFRLVPREQSYLRAKPLVLEHARDFIAQRLAPRDPPYDGKQTPFRGHPVFVAQHATATCCRTCLAKWHGIAAGCELSEAEQTYVLAVLERWLRRQQGDMEPAGSQR